MRRTTSLILIATVLAVLGVTLQGGASRSEGADGEPGDTCSQAPDRPLGWQFQDACGAHDGCIDALGLDVTVESRLQCDVEFLDDLMDAPHTVAVSTCGDNLVCRSLAQTYYLVVRFVTERLLPAVAN
jgi:hypothetical protein